MELKLGVLLLASCALTGTAAAQRRAPKAEIIEEELERKQRQFAETESRLQRLQELRLRLDFGLSVQAERYLTLDSEQRELVREGGNERLITEEAEVQRLSMQASTLAEQCDRARRELTERSKDKAGDGMPIPILGSSSPSKPMVSKPVGTTPSMPREAPSIERSTRPPPPLPSSRPARSDGQEANPTPVAGHSKIITGSGSRSDVGRVLLYSGEDLLAQAKRSTDSTAAAELTKRAMQMLEAAKRELEPLSKGNKAKLIDLYQLARCEEKLGNRAAADSLYAEIISRDHKQLPDGTEEYGKWGRAAQAAKSVLRWMDDFGNWKPARDPAEIRWDGESK